MRDIKLVTIDIDKTLINDEGYIPEKNAIAIRKACEMGCNVVLVSGRIGPSVRKFMKELGISGLVPSLGGCMIETWSGDIISDYGLSIDDSLLIYDMARRYEQYPLAFRHSDWLSDPENEYWNKSEFEATGLKGVILDLRNNLASNKPNKLLVPSLDEQIVLTLEKEINTVLANSVKCFLSSPNYLEVMPKGINKGTVVNNLIDYYKINKNQVLSIGDYYNDVDMFSAAGNSAVPDNAPDDIKSLVDYVSPFDNNNAAVARIFEEYVL